MNKMPTCSFDRHFRVKKLTRRILLSITISSLVFAPSNIILKYHCDRIGSSSIVINIIFDASTFYSNKSNQRVAHNSVCSLMILLSNIQ